MMDIRLYTVCIAQSSHKPQDGDTDQMLAKCYANDASISCLAIATAQHEVPGKLDIATARR